MHDHIGGRARGEHQHQNANANDVAPGRTTQQELHEQHVPTSGRAGGSVFDAYRKPQAKSEQPHSEHGPHKAKASSGGEVHIITHAGLHHLKEDGAAGRDAVHELYDNPNAYVVCKDGQHVPHGCKAKEAILFPSFKEFEAAHKAGRIPKSADAVVYDNEHWSQTPPNEKTNAVHFAKKFGDLAHSLGLVYIAAPTQKWFKADARFADIIDVQLQSREVHKGSYERTLKADANFAHHHNPGEKVVAQISSNKNHLDPDHSGNIGDGVDKVEDEITDSAPYVDGFWGYLYQQNKKSVNAGQHILEDLAKKREKGKKI